MFSLAREEPNDTSRVDGCRRLPRRAACVSALSPRWASTTVFTGWFSEEEPVDTLR